MEEVLRRAYLAAMDIPVWLPRGAAEPLPEPQLPVLPREAPREEQAGLRAAKTPARAPVAPPRRPASAASPARAAAGPAERLLLGFASAGRTLFIEDLAEPRSPRAAAELLASLAFVIEGRRLSPALQEFAWPPPGVPFLAGEARDAVRGRIDRVAAEGLDRLVLLGPAPARVLLHWDAPAWLSRAPGPCRLEGLGCPVLCLPTVAAMLREAAAKREAWCSLRLVGAGG